MTPTTIFRAFKPELRETDLPAGVIGQVAGIAVVYDQLDDYGTMFAPTSLDRTIRERVASGKVKLYWDHGDAPLHGFYDSDLHVGTVRSIENVKLPDGKTGAYMVADLFDTPKGREVKDYLRGVLATGGETGLSVGGRSKGIKSETTMIDGQPVERFTEFPLREISITSMQAVPNSTVLAVRQTDDTSNMVSVASDGIDSSLLITTSAALLGDPNTFTGNATLSGLAVTFKTTGVICSPVTDQAAALRALLRSMPEELIRAELRAFFGNATTEDSDADESPSPDSDATAEDSPQYATMEQRLDALRSLYRKAS